MGAGEYKFRSAAFGGFHRQDVLNYIELSVRMHNETLAQLKSALESERSTHASLERKLADSEQALAAASAEKSRLAAETDRARRSEESARAARAEMAARVDELERALTEIRANCEKFGPAAAAYEELKDHTATIELEAHQRAHAIVARAEERAAHIRTLCAQWVAGLQAGYSRLRSDVDTTVTQTLDNLRCACQTVEEISARFVEYDKQVSKLTEDSRTPPEAE